MVPASTNHVFEQSCRAGSNEGGDEKRADGVCLPRVGHATSLDDHCGHKDRDAAKHVSHKMEHGGTDIQIRTTRCWPATRGWWPISTSQVRICAAGMHDP